MRSGFHDLISDHHSGPVEDDDVLFDYNLHVGKLSLVELFNFENVHWAMLYQDQAKKSFAEELALYDLLNEDAGTGDGLEVDVDETTADILIG